MIKAILLVAVGMVINMCCYGQQEEDKKLYVLKDTVVTGLDTINLIHTKLKIGMKLKKGFSFEAGSGDTILYSLKKENNTQMKYRVIKPNSEEKEYILNDDVKHVRLETEAGAGNYELKFKNRSFKKNYVIIDLKKVRGWSRIEKLKKYLPQVDTVVVINDTVPRIVLEASYYIGAKKNIMAESEKVIEFQFVADSVPNYWSYLVGFGKEYQNKVTNLINLKTQQPVGDALVAHFMQQNNQIFPYSKSKRAKMNFTGPGVNKNFDTTAHYTSTGKRGIYKLSVINKDEVVGEYIYIKVVAFDLVKKSEIKVPMSEFKKIN